MSAKTSSSSTPSPPTASFGCEAQQTYSFPLHCKRSFHPTLTHQFEVVWPWPAARHATPQPAGFFATGAAPLKRERADVGVDSDDTVQESARAARPLWRDRRHYGRPTFILDFSSDPFLAALETRRVGLLLSPGYRLLLPLSTLGPPEVLPDNAGVAYWKPVFKAPPEASPSTAPPPHCAELVIGEVAAVEKAVRQLHESSAASANHPSAHRSYVKPPFFSRVTLGLLKSHDTAAAAPAESMEVDGDDSSISACSSPPPALPPASSSAAAAPTPSAQKHVQSFFFYTIPFRIRWLSQLQGRLVVTLPCEERIVTLEAPHHLSPTPITGATVLCDNNSCTARAAEPLPITQVHSFALPRGVMPLDVAEIFDRPFLAVGTHEHGVLLCYLNPITGAVESTVRCISLKGYGGAVFPVTRLVTLFPPLHAATILASSPPWVQRAAALESLRDGVVVCSSLYEPSTMVVKLDGAPEGVVEDFATMRAVDTVLDVSPTVQPDLGAMVCTASRKVVWLRFLDADEEEEKLTTVRGKRNDFGVAERVHPSLLCERMARLDFPLMRLMASPPVLQSFAGKYVSRHQYTKHWRLGVDNRNQVVLMDRTVSQYVFQSAFQLYRRSHEEQHAAPSGSLLTGDTATAGHADGAVGEAKNLPPVKQEPLDADEVAVVDHPQSATATAKGAKRGRAPSATVARTPAKPSNRRSAKQPKAEPGDEDGAGAASGGGVMGAAQAFASSVPLEDACSGVAVVFARDETIQVAAAHDRRYISVVTWRIGPPPPPPPAKSFFSPALKAEK
jgi:hypothetical protein